MQKFIVLLYKILLRIVRPINHAIEQFLCKLWMYLHNVKHKDFYTNGFPYLSIAVSGACNINSGFRMNNGLKGNPIGRPQRCVLFVDRNAILTIGKNVGMSSTAIICHKNIVIGDCVKIGGGVCIYDTDFHSLDSSVRNSNKDLLEKKCKEVVIKDNVFIGAHSTILKGVTIGENSIIGACSVVSKSVPNNQIWAGNPATFIRNL